MGRRETFETIYREKLFGAVPGERFYSGNGSVGQFNDSYCELVAQIIHEKGITSIVDLGCGDFRIGRRLAALVDDYVGVDIVPDLIEQNRKEYGSKHLSFACLDIVEDPLPKGDLCLVRQVLQHLNNAEISTVLSKLGIYRWALITENVSAGEVKCPNVDHVHGPETRLVEGSGVFLTEPPFSLGAAKTWELPYDETSILLTVLIDTSNSTVLK